ncbi:uncharacterized protein N7473_007373 [Penicillium subrubescens]|uniref:uncharacterized protein n=1 Tax=Penicillium subrubescens TaxID=1316194 RepID=UPI0025450736|nr:uncharacterized protein N7473_007373 [Penicillium subrubescens]KAJ5891145.1 hypothetical protein N7473_007373 [Penicillium subrubescens]
MVLLTATNRMVTALEAVPESQRSELNLPATLHLHEPITHEQLLRLAKHLQNDAAYQSSTTTADEHSRTTVLNTLLRGTKVYIPPPPKKPEPSPEYLASKARLLAEAERAAYQRLLNPTYTPNPDHADPHASSPDAAEDTLTPSLVFNIFLSVVITGFSVYWALTKFTMPAILARTLTSWTGPGVEEAGREATGGASDAVRVLISFFAALSVAVAEAFLYGAYLEKVSRARAKEKRVKERKTFVGVVEGEKKKADESGDVSVDAEADVDQKEEIWGKGVNGGVRRRVREKWEKEKDDEL